MNTPETRNGYGPGTLLDLLRSSLPALQRHLSQLQSHTEALRVQLSEELAQEEGVSTLTARGSPLSVYSRVKEATDALKATCDRHAAYRAATMAGSVELYWLARAHAQRTELLWRSLELEDLNERERLVGEVSARFRALIPAPVIANFQHAAHSPGQLAIAIGEAQGRSAELARTLDDALEDKGVSDDALVRADVALANAQSLLELNVFEISVLQWRPEARQETKPKADVSVLSGLARLRTVRESAARAHAEANACESDAAAIKAMLAHAIDLMENQHDFDEAHRLFATCRALARRSLETAHADEMLTRAPL